MAGISDKAIKTKYAENKYRFNDGSELASKEFSDGSGLEMYETDFRGYDPQLGRFWQIDPLADGTPGFSPYAFANDNPINFNDPLGLASGKDTGTAKMDLDPVVVTPPKTPDRTGVNSDLADTKGYDPATIVADAPISNGNSSPDDNGSSSTANGGILVLTVGSLAEVGEGIGITITGTASIPVVAVGLISYGVMKWAWPTTVPQPTNVPTGDISIGVPRIYIPNIHFSKQKEDHLKGGKQNQRDASIKRYPKDFQRWYHREYKQPGDSDATAEELKELFEEWESLGRPKAN